MYHFVILRNKTLRGVPRKIRNFLSFLSRSYNVMKIFFKNFHFTLWITQNFGLKSGYCKDFHLVV
ncbi:MAG: hypothetical protein A3J63_04560 [Candidatus Moranbacteria bacterium RIFCSPHIGHO2_02_FULL_40_12b]|nr:MAG: hypothetical protein A3J63_04560 [Candidatus Moranbacteria bacterium RIFCSPHIGHO2_02_FULL_40_12b]OGI24057.1 MAG: hypothetical protein A3E91_03990 [Candidatus Moranbacteria bacterium RIFCSPHIGHO2_12_FULL_40_10]